MAATASDVVKVARSQVGYRESGTNHQKYSPAVPGLEWSQNQPWCHTFMSWVGLKAGAGAITPKTASCLAGVAWFKARGRFNKTPKKGSFVYYGTGGATHVELVVAVDAKNITTVGGNTSGSLDGKYFNGDGVYEKKVARTSTRIYGYGHPAYKAEPKPAAKKPPAKTTASKKPAPKSGK
ncbi:CHAP domain-containing protein [Acrocarpospora sp. B8E8]|uniref:CHAP domain-containing protein n=1 Tax=Acrocarpospora sp. B8E8 TaxID=3153572 RepID=UPI00325F78B7